MRIIAEVEYSGVRLLRQIAPNLQLVEVDGAILPGEYLSYQSVISLLHSDTTVSFIGGHNLDLLETFQQFVLLYTISTPVKLEHLKTFINAADTTYRGNRKSGLKVHSRRRLHIFVNNPSDVPQLMKPDV